MVLMLIFIYLHKASSSGNKSGAAIGGAVGGVAFLIIVILLMIFVLFYIKHSRNKKCYTTNATLPLLTNEGNLLLHIKNDRSFNFVCYI